MGVSFPSRVSFWGDECFRIGEVMVAHSVSVLGTPLCCTLKMGNFREFPGVSVVRTSPFPSQGA